jgi:TonB-dependent receptor
MNSRIARTIHLVLAIASGTLIAQTASAQAAAGETAGQTVENEGSTIENVVVVGRQRSAATDVAEERLEKAVVVDLLGAEQISRVGDSSVSLALRRLPGVTLVSDQFIYVRGLGERYSSTTLNGANVPSPDLTRNVIPLDIFPAAIIDSLSVTKGYTADESAAFGGGAVDIRTRSIPDEPVLSFEIGSGWNSESDSSSLTYPGGSDDRWGTDDGTRELPSAIRDAYQTYRGDISPVNILDTLRMDGGSYTIADAQAINRDLATSLNRNIDFTQGTPDPDISAEAVAGNSWYFGDGDEWKFGVLGLVDYGNQWRTKERVNRSQQFPDVTVTRTQLTTNQVNLTGSLNLGLEYTADHRIEASGLYLQTTDDEAALARRNNNNFQVADGLGLREYRIRYEERSLELMQFRGTHTLGEDTVALLGDWVPNIARELTFEWYYSDSTAETDIPSEILISADDRVDPATGEMLSTSVRASTSAAEYRFTELSDEVKSYGWELRRPFQFGGGQVEIAGGWERYEKGRGYMQNQLGFGTQSPSGGGVLAGTPGQVLTDDAILDPANNFQLGITGTGTESYLAAETVDAAYGKFDLTWNDTWRVAGGVRFEDFQRITVPIDPLEFDVNVGKIPIPIDQLESLATAEDDYYPALALTYMRPDFWSEEFQLRLGFSQTVTRPDLREVANATYIDPLTDARIRGNPDLITANLTNVDLRADWFFGSGDSFTLTAFYKDIENPIETVQGAGSDDILALTFINAEAAELYGLEVEGFKGDPFGPFLGGWADGLFLSGNVTWSESEITIGSQALNVTNNKRSLTQHSEYVANVQLGYDSPGGMHSATVVYNVFGERIFFAGVNGAPDAYEQPFNSLDLSYSFFPTDKLTFKVRVQNLLDAPIEIEQGGVTVLEQTIGMTYRLDAQMKF